MNVKHKANVKRQLQQQKRKLENQRNNLERQIGEIMNALRALPNN